MIKRWLEDRCIQWLVSRGFFCIKHPNIPYLIMTCAAGTFRKDEGGWTTYVIYMPEGHKLVTMLDTILIADNHNVQN
jgi:hypothetical protein